MFPQGPQRSAAEAAEDDERRPVRILRDSAGEEPRRPSQRRGGRRAQVDRRRAGAAVVVVVVVVEVGVVVIVVEVGGVVLVVVVVLLLLLLQLQERHQQDVLEGIVVDVRLSEREVFGRQTSPDDNMSLASEDGFEKPWQVSRSKSSPSQLVKSALWKLDDDGDRNHADDWEECTASLSNNGSMAYWSESGDAVVAYTFADLRIFININ